MEPNRPYEFRDLQYRGENGVLIPLLQRAQAEEGWVSEERLEEIHRRTGLPLAHVFGVATFYAQFRLRPVGRNVVKVCHGTACHVANANALSRALEEQLGIGDGETTADREFTLETVSCLGCCSLAPVVMVGRDTHGNLKPADLKRVLAPYRGRQEPGRP